MDTVSPGDTLRGKYRIERSLGSGGMAHIYLATHVRLGRKVAVKLLAASAAKRPRALERFAQEARAAACLRSEHVVRILDVDDADDGTPFLVMEYLQGTDLDRRLFARGALPVEEAVDYVLQACAGLAEAHAAGIIHRDLKPANLFLAKERDGESIKLLDFGIAKAMEEGNETGSLTDAATVIGSPCFMSPEQVRAAKDLDARSDIWSLGVILYQLVSDSLPFQAVAPTALAVRICSDPPAPLQLNPSPAGFEKALMRFFEKEREKRYASALEAARALAPFGGPRAAERVARVERDGALAHDPGEVPELPLSDGAMAAAKAVPTLVAPQDYHVAADHPSGGGIESDTALQETIPADASSPGVGTDYASSLRTAPDVEAARIKWAPVAAAVVVVLAGIFYLAQRTREVPALQLEAPRVAAPARSPAEAPSSAPTPAPSVKPPPEPVASAQPSASAPPPPPASVRRAPPPAPKDPLDIDLK